MKKQERIKVVIVEPMKAPRVEEIENTLEEKQAIVGGWIECLSVDTINKDCKPYTIICNEEGKLNRLPLNRGLYHEYPLVFDEPWEIISGTFIVVADDWESGEFISLTDEQIEEVMERFKYPEQFVRVGGLVLGIPIK